MRKMCNALESFVSNMCIHSNWDTVKMIKSTYDLLFILNLKEPRCHT